MKQAILITAYTNFKHLLEIIKCFNSSFEFYIHIDKKSKASKILNVIKAQKNVKYINSKYSVNWGGYNHLKCILHLVNLALNNEDIQYFHLISGQDFPTKNPEYFTEFLTKNYGKDYLSYHEFPTDRWPNGGIDRIEYFNFYDVFNAKSKQISWIYRAINLQRKLRIKRKLSKKIPKLYGGSTWWTLKRETLLYIQDFTQNNKPLLNRLKYTFCSEEFYFQTVIMNSEFSKNVVNNNLRFIDWNDRNGSNPAFLDKTDLENINNSENLFARKFRKEISHELQTLLKKQINY